MHSLIHYGIRIGFALVIGILFPLMIAIRPGARKLSKTKLAFLFVVGLIIAAVFFSTQSLYEIQTTF